MQVERMRQAILQNIIQPERVFAHPPLPMMAQGNPYHQPPYPGHQGQIHMRPAGAPPPQPMGGPPGHRMMGRGRGLLGENGKCCASQVYPLLNLTMLKCFCSNHYKCFKC